MEHMYIVRTVCILEGVSGPYGVQNSIISVYFSKKPIVRIFVKSIKKSNEIFSNDESSSLLFNEVAESSKLLLALLAKISKKL
jgi:hypothetical protein